jgi:hypothetical protein
MVMHDIQLAIVPDVVAATSLPPGFVRRKTRDFRAFLCLKPRGVGGTRVTVSMFRISELAIFEPSCALSLWGMPLTLSSSLAHSW